MGVHEVELAHLLEILTREPAAKPTYEVPGEPDEQLLPVDGTRVSELVVLDDPTPDQPVERGHRSVDRTNGRAPCVLDQVCEIGQNGAVVRGILRVSRDPLPGHRSLPQGSLEIGHHDECRPTAHRQASCSSSMLGLCPPRWSSKGIASLACPRHVPAEHSGTSGSCHREADRWNHGGRDLMHPDRAATPGGHTLASDSHLAHGRTVPGEHALARRLACPHWPAGTPEPPAGLEFLRDPRVLVLAPCGPCARIPRS